MVVEASAPAAATSVLRFMVDLAKTCPPFACVFRRAEFLENYVELYFSCVRYAFVWLNHTLIQCVQQHLQRLVKTLDLGFWLHLFITFLKLQRCNHYFDDLACIYRASHAVKLARELLVKAEKSINDFEDTNCSQNTFSSLPQDQDHSGKASIKCWKFFSRTGLYELRRDTYANK